MNELTDRLRSARANMLGADEEDLYFTCHEAAGEIERLLEAVPKWIDVEKALPPDNQAVVVWNDMTGMEVAYRERETWRMIWSHQHVGCNAYTHWMPAPKGPDEK